MRSVLSFVALKWSRLLASVCFLGMLFVQGAQAQRLPSDAAGERSLQQAPDPPFTLSSVVRHTLDAGTAIRTEREQMRGAQGRLQAAAGAFDVRVDASLSSGIDNTLYTRAQQQQFGVSKANQGLSSYEVGLSKQFHSGLVVRPSVSVSRTDALTLSSAPVLRKEAGLAMTYPLLRGRGQNLAEAEVDAAGRSVQASRLSLRHTVAQSLRDAAYAYWDYRAAYRRLQILRGSEARARTLLNETKALVEGGERPRSTLGPLHANVADKVAARINAEQSLREARRSLGLAMGVSQGEIAVLPAPTEPFPTAGDTLRLPPRERLIERALSERADLRSASMRTNAARLLLEAQRNATRPRFDLQANMGYVGLSDGEGLSVFQHAPPLGQSNVGGPTVSLGLSYSIPLENNGARGRLAQQQVTHRQRQIIADDLRRRASSGVAVAYDMLVSSRAGVDQSHRAVRSYRVAIEDERKKLRHGMSTLLDVTTVEDRLTSALSSLIAAQTRYARALVRLRYETGTLLVNDDRSRIAERFHLQAQRLKEVPSIHK